MVRCVGALYYIMWGRLMESSYLFQLSNPASQSNRPDSTCLYLAQQHHPRLRTYTPATCLYFKLSDNLLRGRIINMTI